jgi:iron-sulfur cluster insertion protein
MIITESAKNRISDLCIQNGKMVRLSITSGGCQGFNKVWDFDTSSTVDDVSIDCYQGSLLIDQVSLEIINDATVDYVINLDGSYFVVDIPSATSVCGCGNSFSI